MPDSYQCFLNWLECKPWSDGGRLSKGNVQQTLLAIGLAYRALDLVVFDEPDGSHHPDDYPDYMAACPWGVAERGKLDVHLGLLWKWLQEKWESLQSTL